MHSSKSYKKFTLYEILLKTSFSAFLPNFGNISAKCRIRQSVVSAKCLFGKVVFGEVSRTLYLPDLIGTITANFDLCCMLHICKLDIPRIFFSILGTVPVPVQLGKKPMGKVSNIYLKTSKNGKNVMISVTVICFLKVNNMTETHEN